MYCFVTIAQVQYSRVTQLNSFYNARENINCPIFQLFSHLLSLHSIVLVVTQSKNQGPLLPQDKSKFEESYLELEFNKN
jgi:hypothetical protein